MCPREQRLALYQMLQPFDRVGRNAVELGAQQLLINLRDQRGTPVAEVRERRLGRLIQRVVGCRAARFSSWTRSAKGPRLVRATLPHCQLVRQTDTAADIRFAMTSVSMS